MVCPFPNVDHSSCKSNSLGGQNSQNLSEAGKEANLDVQFAFGISYPIKVESIPSLLLSRPTPSPVYLFLNGRESPFHTGFDYPEQHERVA